MCTNLAAWLIEYSNIAIITGNQLDLFDLRSHLANNVETCSPKHDGNQQPNNRNTLGNLRLPLFLVGFHHVVYFDAVPPIVVLVQRIRSWAGCCPALLLEVLVGRVSFSYATVIWVIWHCKNK